MGNALHESFAADLPRPNERQNSSTHVSTNEILGSLPVQDYEDYEDAYSTDGDVLPPRAFRVDAPRDLSWRDAASLIINKTVGLGIFTGPYIVLHAIQDPQLAIMLWVLGFLYTASSMWLYLEYARDLPYTGGELTFLDHTIRRPIMLAYTVYSFYYTLVYTSAPSALQFAYQVLVAYDPQISGYDQINRAALCLIAVCVITLVCLMLYFSTAKSKLMNQATALLKVLLLAAVIIAGGLYIGRHGKVQHSSSDAGDRDWVQAFLTVLFSYHGWDNATLVAGEIPRYSVLRKGFIVGVCVIGICYISVAVIYSFAFDWGLKPFDYMARFFGDSDEAKAAAATLTAMSAFGSILSISYTCVRVKQAIGCSGILPWSSIWKRCAPVRPRYETTQTGASESQFNNDDLPVLKRGTPEGGVILHWLVSVTFVCISIAMDSAKNAIFYSAPLMVYGHFFVSLALGFAFPCFKRSDPDECPVHEWQAPPPSAWLSIGSRSWIGRGLVGILPFAFSLTIIVCTGISASLRYNFLIMVAVLGFACVYWVLFINENTAGRLYTSLGLSARRGVHGKDDYDEYDRQCDLCQLFEKPDSEHRHAQEGYKYYHGVFVSDNHPASRLLYRFFGGSDKAAWLDIALDNINVRRLYRRREPQEAQGAAVH